MEESREAARSPENAHQTMVDLLNAYSTIGRNTVGEREYRVDLHTLMSDMQGWRDQLRNPNDSKWEATKNHHLEIIKRTTPDQEAKKREQLSKLREAYKNNPGVLDTLSDSWLAFQKMRHPRLAGEDHGAASSSLIKLFAKYSNGDLIDFDSVMWDLLEWRRMMTPNDTEWKENRIQDSQVAFSKYTEQLGERQSRIDILRQAYLQNKNLLDNFGDAYRDSKYHLKNSQFPSPEAEPMQEAAKQSMANLFVQYSNGSGRNLEVDFGGIAVAMFGWRDLLNDPDDAKWTAEVIRFASGKSAPDRNAFIAKLMTLRQAYKYNADDLENLVGAWHTSQRQLGHHILGPETKKESEPSLVELISHYTDRRTYVFNFDSMVIYALGWRAAMKAYGSADSDDLETRAYVRNMSLLDHVADAYETDSHIVNR